MSETKHVSKTATIVTSLVLFALLIGGGVWAVTSIGASIAASQATNIPAQQRDAKQAEINRKYGMTP